MDRRLAPRDLTTDGALVDRTARLLFETFPQSRSGVADDESTRREVLDSLAPDRISRVMVDHIGAVIGWIGAIRNMGLGPRWYPIALAVLAIPQCWLGGRIYIMAHPHAVQKSGAAS